MSASRVTFFLFLAVSAAAVALLILGPTYASAASFREKLQEQQERELLEGGSERHPECDYKCASGQTGLPGDCCFGADLSKWGSSQSCTGGHAFCKHDESVSDKELRGLIASVMACISNSTFC